VCHADIGQINSAISLSLDERIIVMLSSLSIGVAASALAALTFVAWVAVGSLIRPPRAGRYFLDIAVSILVGSAVTSIGYTIVSLLGLAKAGAGIVFAAAILAAVLRRRQLGIIARDAIAEFRSIMPVDVFSRVALSVATVVLATYATAPPRDGDVIRYHLAHIRQIAMEGSWHWVPDVMYALPFGWLFNYLPFEVASLPQGAAFLNVFLWFAVLLLIVEATAVEGDKKLGLLICLCFMVHPYVVKVFTAAFPDAHAILITAVLGIMLTRIDEFGKRDATLFGFVCWIGIASRYQMVATSVAVSAITMVHFARARNGTHAKFFVAGAATAVVASSPFYWMNWKNTGNPVWPLSLPFFSTGNSYVEKLGFNFGRQFTWPALEPLVVAVRRLFTSPYLAPLPILLVLLSITALFSRDKAIRRVGLFSCLYLGFWVAMSPRLYPTHILPIVGLGPLMAISLLQKRAQGPSLAKFLTPALRLMAGAFLALSLAFASDYARYDFTGNAKEYHRFTWYYPVYDWANHNTPPESRFLVVVFSGLSYYLDRPYRRADPWLSAEINWSRVGSPATLDSIMKQRGFDYLIYDDRYWNQYPGGKLMTGVVHSAVSRKFLVPVYHSREKLYSGRVRRQFAETDVYVYKRADLK
jgi:hypothetical protein